MKHYKCKIVKKHGKIIYNGLLKKKFKKVIQKRLEKAKKIEHRSKDIENEG